MFQCPLCLSIVSSLYPVAFTNNRKEWVCEECAATWEYPNLFCKECGRRFVPNKNVSLDTCFTCWLWLRRLEEFKELRGTVFVFKGWYFSIGDGKLKPKGFDGQKFHIFFKDGSVIETDDLWCGGKIPDRFLSRFEEDVMKVEPSLDAWIDLNERRCKNECVK